MFFAGENREALVRPDDPSFPLMSSYAGLLPAGDPDQGVPVGQVFSPGTCSSGAAAVRRGRSSFTRREISYGDHFEIRIAGRADRSARLRCSAATTTRTALLRAIAT